MSRVKREEQFNISKIWVLKAFAIFCVVCAHSVGDYEGKVGKLIIRIMDMVGTMGVPVFFILSGYLFHPEKYTFHAFWKSKVRNIIMPWVFCDTLVWLYVVLRKGGISLWEWVKFLLGVNHSTYYLTVLCFLYLLFWLIKNKKVIVVGAATVSFVWLGMICSGMLDISYTINYLNPLNWMVYFSVGILLQNVSHDKIFGFCKRCMPLSMFLLAVSMVLHLRNDWEWTYWSGFSLVNLFLSTIVLMGVADLKIWEGNKLFPAIGKMSFSIYL
ncbi:MAG: acyltransferase [Lachnospiraceae bacterium]|nr:acyltransferase [Lachnospiraceae bacterium]